MLKNTRQINYWTLGGFEGTKPIPQALEEANAMGYEGLELTFGAGVFAPGISEQECSDIRKTARHLGMKIESLATGVYWEQSLAAPKKRERERAIDFTKEYLHVAKWVGAKTVLVIPGAVAVPWDASQPVIPYADVWKEATASLRRCVPLAKKLGVTLGIENVWNWFLADPIAMKSFVDQFKTKRVGVYFDVANCLLNGYPQHWIDILGKRIAGMHWKNFTRTDCGGTLHGFGDDILRGDVPWTDVVKAIKRVKYTGPITAEMIPFSRLPHLKLPDMRMADDTAGKMKKIAAKG